MSRATEAKVCASCGRDFAWRKKWATCWDRVRYCSARCRARRPSGVDAELEQAILELLKGRPRGSTICPSEVARTVRPDAWRHWMERTRAAVRRLVAAGRVEITQRGHVVDPATARGPIRVRAKGD